MQNIVHTPMCTLRSLHFILKRVQNKLTLVKKKKKAKLKSELKLLILTKLININ